MTNKLDNDCYNLDLAFYKWIVPRLKRFKKITKGHPAAMTEEQWNLILNEMINGFSSKDIINEPDELILALTHFRKYIHNLWF